MIEVFFVFLEQNLPKAPELPAQHPSSPQYIVVSGHVFQGQSLNNDFQAISSRIVKIACVVFFSMTGVGILILYWEGFYNKSFHWMMELYLGASIEAKVDHVAQRLSPVAQHLKTSLLAAPTALPLPQKLNPPPYLASWKGTFAPNKQPLYLIPNFSKRITRSFIEVDAQEVLRLQKQIQNTNKNFDSLVLKTWQDEGLLPKYKMRIDNATYYISPLFQPITSYCGALALIQIDNQIFPRIIYRSKSQGVWRVVPALIKIDDGTDARWLGKGLAESDTALPIQLNLALNAMCPIAPPEKRYKRALDIVKDVTQTAYTYKSSVSMKDFAHVPEHEPQNFYRGHSTIEKPPDPHLIQMPQEMDDLPNFEKPIYEMPLTLPEYGEITAKVFSSRSKKFIYLFYEIVEDQRAFLASVELIHNNPIVSFGVRSLAPSLYGLDSPALDYGHQIPEEFYPFPYRDYSCFYHYKSKKYCNAWNYVRGLSIIQNYYKQASSPREVPPEMHFLSSASASK